MVDVADEDNQRNAQEMLDALLNEGVESGPSTLMTPQDWIDIRQEVRQLAGVQDRT